MTFPTLPTRWGEILTLASLTFGLTATLVKGAGTEQCGANSLCGYGSICDTKTSQCVCLSGKDGKRKREGNPHSTFYCFGVGVTKCGDKLCGYRAKCNTDIGGCGCSINNDELKELEGTSPSLWYCVEFCSSNNTCNDNTACTDPSNNGRYRCNCLQGSTLSPTGQCLGELQSSDESSGKNTSTQYPDDVTWRNNSRPTTFRLDSYWAYANIIGLESDDSRALTIGLATGIGGVVLVAVIVLVAVVLARRRKSKRANDNELASLRRQSSHPHSSRDPSRHTYQSAVDPPLPGQSGMDNPAGPTVIVHTEVSVINPPPRPGAYEDVDNDFPVIYSTAKVTNKWNKNKANQAQQASNAISPPSQSGVKAEPKNVNDPYSNQTISFNKTQQIQKKNEGSSENMENQYNTLYDLKPADSNTAGIALRGNLEYDEIKLQKV